MAMKRPANPPACRRIQVPEVALVAAGPPSSKSRTMRYLYIALLVMVALSMMGYVHRLQGAFEDEKNLVVLNRVGGDVSCTIEVARAIPFLIKAYGDSMHKVLHVGPDTCSIVERLMREKVEAFGVEPYDVNDADTVCKKMVHRGLVRVFNLKYPLPYRPRSFSLVIVSDSLDYMSPNYVNKTLPELANLSSDGIVIFTGYPRNQKARLVDNDKFGRPAKMRSMTWWVKLFIQLHLEENEHVVKKFERAAEKKAYWPRCQIFHLKSYL